MYKVYAQDSNVFGPPIDARFRGNSSLLLASNPIEENCSSPVFGPLSGEGRARGEPR